MSDVTREPPRLCLACGYETNAVAPFDPGHRATPAEGDLSLCMNCGAPYARHGLAWVPMTDAERAALTDEVREEFEQAERSRARTIRQDLRRGRGGTV
jgi:hypothetical protein